jgi:hypothetical protein
MKNVIRYVAVKPTGEVLFVRWPNANLYASHRKARRFSNVTTPSRQRLAVALASTPPTDTGSGEVTWFTKNKKAAS